MTAKPNRIPFQLGVARVLLGLIGLVTLAGAIYFTFFASAEEGGVSTAADWFVAIWSIAMSVAYLAAALMLRNPTRQLLIAAVGLVALHMVFGVVKLVGYNEVESFPFFIADLLALALLVLALRGQRAAVPA